MAFPPWIKIEQTLPDKPEVIRMGGLLRLDPDAVVGKLLRVWIWADANVVTGNHVALTEGHIDRMTHCKKFARAMREVGWLTGTDGDLTFPGFDRHNGETAKERAQTARRNVKLRQNKSDGEGVTDVTVAASRSPSPRCRSRRREEDTPLPPAGGVSGSASEDDLIRSAKALRKNWQASPFLSKRERRQFRHSSAMLGAFTPEDWTTLAAFMAARLPDGTSYFQPQMLEKFLENPGNALGHARDWQGKQRPKLTIAPPPLPVSDEPPASPEERKALLKII